MRPVFVFENREVALAWQRSSSQQSSTPEYVYGVTLTDPTCAVHRADMAWVDAFEQFRTFEGVEHCARQFWRGVVCDIPGSQSRVEWIVAGTLSIAERLTRIADDLADPGTASGASIR